MTITVLYPEDRQIPDLALEQEIFGPEVRLIRAAKPSFAELDATDCAAADGLMIMRWAVTEADLDRFPQLRCVVRMGVGYDKLDRKALAGRNILVCHVPDYGTTEVADHAIALVLTLRRGILLHHELQRRDPPAPWRSFHHPMIRRQRRMDRQGVGLPQQFLQARGAVDAERQFDTVRQVGIVEHDTKVECLGAHNATAVPMRPNPMIPKFCTLRRRIIGW